jgi:hypothetical protein
MVFVEPGRAEYRDSQSEIVEGAAAGHELLEHPISTIEIDQQIVTPAEQCRLGE